MSDLSVDHNLMSNINDNTIVITTSLSWNILLELLLNLLTFYLNPYTYIDNTACPRVNLTSQKYYNRNKNIWTDRIMNQK